MHTRLPRTKNRPALFQVRDRGRWAAPLGGFGEMLRVGASPGQAALTETNVCCAGRVSSSVGCRVSMLRLTLRQLRVITLRYALRYVTSRDYA